MAISVKTQNTPDVETLSASNSSPIIEAAFSASTSNLIELANTIKRETERLDRYIKDSNLPEPSFDVDAPLTFTKLPDELKKAREEVMRATKELGTLVTGATESIRWLAWNVGLHVPLLCLHHHTDLLKHNNSLSLHFIYAYRIASMVPLHRSISFSTISQEIGLSELNIRRLLRHAMTNRIFHEPVPGFIAHNSHSRVLTLPQINDWVGFCVEDMWPAAAETIPTLKVYPEADDPTKDEKRAGRFSGAMKSLLGEEGYELHYLIDGYDWASLDAKGATIVDVGGSRGYVSIELAKRFPNLKVIVQDLQGTVESAPKLEGEMKDRVKFMSQDFFEEQQVRGADVYILRWIMHNYSDKYASRILQRLIPALKNGARILVNDYCLPEDGKEVGMGEEKLLRTMDLVMLTLCNAQERTVADFRTLFEVVDGRFRFLGAVKAGKMSILEAVWEGGDYQTLVD
ncbi:S-adenosyl-L-methionine-dependent methyltransferase [Hyaloscypha hepaticicola]|uniref:S-adenosyl-L-methionine-dependent methyltransferase n=1 Tax=Hyaloscypha hepaticicola TaxID=2082293 RepID=A0A2J6PJN7_9HELO|nr:S-adenosyl-L-methionine-dependent methyltransferase [Hyaloscypha hepaticicola]